MGGGVSCTSLNGKVNAVHVVVIVVRDCRYKQSLALTATEDSAHHGCVPAGATWLAAFAEGYRCTMVRKCTILLSSPKDIG